ncbi:annexin A4-like [Babylonia areolata]|uniref:annexin A4-like n=1 Tax=Babylonia areolata TaxID=304850 RepID=UPI003FD03966
MPEYRLQWTGSNYPAYQGGGGAAYPPQQFGAYQNSGPPPPPGMSAYNVNQYGAGGYGGYGAQQPGYSPGGGVPGFTVPAVQQCHTMSASMNIMGPMQQMAALATSQVQMMDAHLQKYQMQQQQMMIEMLKNEIRTGEPVRRRRNRRNYDDDEEEEEEEERPAKTPQPDISEEEMKEKVRQRMKQVFIDELHRREQVSGTFEVTEGTVRPFAVYDAEDPVCKWYNENRGEDLAGKKWNCEADCEYFRDAMKGLGTNDDAIIHIVSTRCNAQRQRMKTMFKTLYGRDLIEDIKGELSGDYEELVMALFVSPAEYDAWCVKEAIYGPGTDEQALIEIFMTRTNAQVQEMRQAYPNVLNKHYHGKTPKIEKDIEDDCSGDFKRLLISASQGGRYEIPKDRLEDAVEEIMNPETNEGTGMFQVNYKKLADMGKAEREAKQLVEAGEDRWGTDEETFIRIFATRNYYQMRETWNQYVKLTQRDILNSVDRETSGDFKSGLRAIVMNIRCRPMFFAEKLKKSMKGLGTDERTLIRIIVSRSEIDMVQIKQCFLELTKKTLWRWLKEDTSFNFKKLLQKIVGKD